MQNHEGNVFDQVKKYRLVWGDAKRQIGDPSEYNVEVEAGLRTRYNAVPNYPEIFLHRSGSADLICKLELIVTTENCSIQYMLHPHQMYKKMVKSLFITHEGMLWPKAEEKKE